MTKSSAKISSIMWLNTYIVHSEPIVTAVAVGYLCGFIVAFLLHLKFAYCNILHRLSWWISCTLIGFLIIVTFYGHSVRCILLLILPVLCTSKGRSLIIASAFILAATGPTKNLIENLSVLMASISCGQQQLKEALEHILDLVKSPLLVIKNALIQSVEIMKTILVRIQSILMRGKSLILVLLAGIQNASHWLSHIVEICNKEFGTPFDRCKTTATRAIENCREKLGKAQVLCGVANTFKLFCYTLKILDAVCVLIGSVDLSIFEKIKKDFQTFIEDVKKIFDVSVTFDHDFQYRAKSTQNFTFVKEAIFRDIEIKFRKFAILFSYLNIIETVLLSMVLLNAVYFMYRYLRSPNYHNVYITKEFHEVQEQREKNGQELVLPLTSLEKWKYVELSSCILTRHEVVNITESMLFLLVACIQLFCICFADYSLFWMLSTISFYGHKEVGLKVPSFISVEMKDGGFVTDIVREIVHSFQLVQSNFTISRSFCLPLPRKPNFSRYYLLGFLCFLAWTLLCIQPYGLRLRYLIMSAFYPIKAKERAVHLYNEILFQRISFFKIARRKARRDHSNHKTTMHEFSFCNWIRSYADKCWLYRNWRRRGSLCIICATFLDKSNKIKCKTPGCSGLYCQDCYKKSNNICCICSESIDYGDIQLKDSSDEWEESAVGSNSSFCSNDPNQAMVVASESTTISIPARLFS